MSLKISMKTRINKYILILLILNTFTAFSISKEDVFKNLIEKIEGSEAIYIECSNRSESLDATLRVSKDGKYKLTSGPRIVYCDGESIWNYSQYQRKLIINEYNREEGVSIENLFYAITQDYKVKTIKNTTLSSHGKVYKLTIIPNLKDTDLPEITLWLKKTNYDIVKLYYDSIDFGRETWDIKSIIYHKEDKATYNFLPPRRTQVIDLR